MRNAPHGPGWCFACSIALGIAFAASAHPQSSSRDELAQAAVLADQGRFTEAIRLTEPLLAAGKLRQDEELIARTWNVRGIALRGLGDYESARRSFETALHIVRTKPNLLNDYASILDNLGSVKDLMGQLQESESLRLRALKLHRSAKDRTGAARTCTSLALLAIAVRNDRKAWHFINEASREESMAPQQDLADLASIESTRGLVNEMKRNHRAALAAMNHAIELWSSMYGPTSYPVGICYGLRGEVYGKQQLYSDALDDLRRSLELLRRNGAEGSRTYAINEKVYADLLRHAGMTAQASQVESDARLLLQRIDGNRCDDCVISAESLRNPLRSSPDTNPRP